MKSIGFSSHILRLLYGRYGRQLQVDTVKTSLWGENNFWLH